MKQGIRYLESLGRLDIKPGLQRIQRILRDLGGPNHRGKYILVGGTNGKGSVATAISSVLIEAGYKTGLFTSPHLSKINERIRVNRGDISDEHLSETLLRVKASHLKTGVEPSYFEAVAAAGFYYFDEVGVDFAVIEVGMGGKWDATNVIDPLVSVITNVSHDHTHFLGNTIEEIAGEKAGIIKSGGTLITASNGKAHEIIEQAANTLGSRMFTYKRDFEVLGENTENFSYQGTEWELADLSFGMTASYQLENAAVAAAALEALALTHGIEIDYGAVKRGFALSRIDGRMEVIPHNPIFILDGAHNPAAAKVLVDSLAQHLEGQKITFLLSMMRNKDSMGIMCELSNIAKRFVLTNLPTDGGMDIEVLGENAKRLCVQTHIERDLEKAVRLAANFGDPVCVTGSLYYLDNVKQIVTLGSENQNEERRVGRKK